MRARAAARVPVGDLHDVSHKDFDLRLRLAHPGDPVSLSARLARQTRARQAAPRWRAPRAAAQAHPPCTVMADAAHASYTHISSRRLGASAPPTPSSPERCVPSGPASRRRTNSPARARQRVFKMGELGLNYYVDTRKPALSDLLPLAATCRDARCRPTALLPLAKLKLRFAREAVLEGLNSSSTRCFDLTDALVGRCGLRRAMGRQLSAEEVHPAALAEHRLVRRSSRTVTS